MHNTPSAVLLAFAVALAGCASLPADKPGTASATAAKESARIAAAVTVPAASARKVVMSMTGPKNVVEAKDWSEFKREWRETFAEHAKEAGVTFTFVDGEPPASTEEGTLLMVTVADYRIVGIGSRILFGVMTGNAFIDARVKFLNLRDRSTFGEQQYSTSSSAWGGVFAKVTPQQVDAVASNVFMDLKAAK